MSAPDPVVTLFAQWETARDEFKRVAAEQSALGRTEDDNPEWNRCYNAMEAIELEMMGTRATTVGGIYAKLRLFEYNYGINTDPIPFETVEDLEALNWEDRHVRSALRDAARLAGAGIVGM